jgi:DNA polymerase III alpha subunit (gram-positive type)
METVKARVYEKFGVTLYPEIEIIARSDAFCRCKDGHNIEGDYHTHTYYSDGVSSVEDMVEAAIKKGLKTIAITDHGSGHILSGVREKGTSCTARYARRGKNTQT